jgi:hypothetical protein
VSAYPWHVVAVRVSDGRIVMADVIEGCRSVTDAVTRAMAHLDKTHPAGSVMVTSVVLGAGILAVQCEMELGGGN